MKYASIMELWTFFAVRLVIHIIEIEYTRIIETEDLLHPATKQKNNYRHIIK